MKSLATSAISLASKIAPFICLAFGFLAGMQYCERTPFKLKHEIDPIVVLNIVATIAIAIVITHYGRKRVDELRYAKNLIIEQAQEAIKHGRDIHASFLLCFEDPAANSNQGKLLELTAATRTLSNQLSELEDFVRIANISRFGNKSCSDCIIAFWAFKASITAIPWVEDLKRSGLSNPASRSASDAAWRKLKLQLFELIVIVNKS